MKESAHSLLPSLKLDLNGRLDLFLNVYIDAESTRSHIKTISQVHFKNNDLYKSTKATDNPHNILLKLRNSHNPHSSQSILKMSKSS